ncbi:MAG TPA: DUF302 domain-containing protein [Microbacteriaceae bacterium]
MDNHLIVKKTTLSQDDAVRNLRAAITRRGIAEFAVFDHARAAADVGLKLSGETVVVFGNPAVGTALMQADADVGVELPLRVLVRSAPTGAQLVYADPRRLAERFELGAELGTLEKLAAVLESITDEIAQSDPANP